MHSNIDNNIIITSFKDIKSAIINNNQASKIIIRNYYIEYDFYKVIEINYNFDYYLI